MVDKRLLTLLVVRDELTGRLPEGLRRLASGSSAATVRHRWCGGLSGRSEGIGRGGRDPGPPCPLGRCGHAGRRQGAAGAAGRSRDRGAAARPRRPGVREVAFAHPLVRAAVYDHLGPARRAQLHLTTATLVEDEGAALRHRAAAAATSDAKLAAELEDFAKRETAAGAWASVATALMEVSRLSATRAEREQRLLEAVDAMVQVGDLVQARTFAEQIVGFTNEPLRDSVLSALRRCSMREGWSTL